jgi:prepilin peptidase CpaA
MKEALGLFALLQAGCLLSFATLLVVAGWQDLRTMRIANGISVAIVASFAVWAMSRMLDGEAALGDLALAITCAVAVFLMGAAAFASGAFGGGDVKLLAAATLFAGPALLPDFLIIVGLVGGAIGVAILAGVPIGPAAPATDGTTVRRRLRNGLPYGPAIAAGGLWVAALLAGL